MLVMDQKPRLKDGMEKTREKDTSTVERSLVIRVAEADARIARASGERAVVVLQRGTLDVVLGTPARPNVQIPHEQDEIYFITRGRGVLVHDGRRDLFNAGDFLFVAAGIEHHFEEFTDDLLLWRVFYGARGGESPVDQAEKPT